jgi:hypothetical protein
MKRLVAAAAVISTLALTCAQAASLLNEQQARAKAVNILKGDPYGQTATELAKVIKEVAFLQNGNTKVCGAKKMPVWEFHIVVVTADKDAFDHGVIDGYLVLNARNGRMLCANLPLLD